LTDIAFHTFSLKSGTHKKGSE